MESDLNKEISFLRCNKAGIAGIFFRTDNYKCIHRKQQQRQYYKKEKINKH